MPHKHKRDKSKDPSSFELPPTTFAQPLPALTPGKGSQQALRAFKKPRTSQKRRLKKDINDDTPKGFTRLLQYQALGRHANGLDDGTKAQDSKKRKRGTDGPTPKPLVTASDIALTAGKDQMEKPNVPTIRPGERMSEFSARVDAALPVSGLVGKGTDSNRKTKTEKRMQKMYSQWREEDKRRREKLEEAREEAEENQEAAGRIIVAPEGKNKKRKGKRTKFIGEVGDDDEDPWAELQIARGGPPSSLQDVVQAPPHLSKMSRARFRVQNGTKVEILDVPNAVGSLRKREELGQARKSIVEGYRQLMESKRALVAMG